MIIALPRLGNLITKGKKFLVILIAWNERAFGKKRKSFCRWFLFGIVFCKLFFAVKSQKTCALMPLFCIFAGEL